MGIQSFGSLLLSPIAEKVLKEAAPEVAEEAIQKGTIGIKNLVDTTNKSKAISKQTSNIQNVLHKKPPYEAKFMGSQANRAPGIDGINLENQIADAHRFHKQHLENLEAGVKLGESELSTASAISNPRGVNPSFNLNAVEKVEAGIPAAVGEKYIEHIPGSRGGRQVVRSSIPDIPFKELHHIFGKAMGEKIVSNVWKLIEAVPPKATVEDLINLDYWAKSYGMGMGDYGAEAVNRLSHSATHTHSRKYGIEMSSSDIQAMPFFDDIDELTSYFRETIQNRVLPMRGELDLQQGAYDLIPEKMMIDVEQLKVAKERASKVLTGNYKQQYKQKMPDTPEEVKAAYQTHVWLQEELGVTDEYLINAAKKLDEARFNQDQQLNQVQELLEVERNKAIKSAEGKQIKKSRKSPQKSTTREGQSEEYAANRINPKEATERKMLEAGSPKTEAERQANIKRLKKDKKTGKPAEKPEDMLYQDKKGKWIKRKTAKKQPKSKK